MQFRVAILTVLLLCAAPQMLLAKETKDIKYSFKNADPVTFSHDIHLKQYNNNCRICHNTIYDLKDRRHYTMQEMEKTKSCGACHTGVKAFSVATDKDCVNCHKGKARDIEYSMKGAPDATFSHSSHLAKLGGKCKACHNGKTIITGQHVTMAEMEKGKSCGACHNDKKAFTAAGNCGNCHKGMKTREITFKSKGIAPALFSHKVHTAAYSCKECHTKLFPYQAGVKHATMAQMEKGKSCGACHDGKTTFSAAGDCNKCHKGYKPGNITFKNPGGPVKFSHEYHLGMYKCQDCHTKIFPYKAGVKHYTMFQMDQGKSCGACHNQKDAFGSTGDCDKCHTK
ncbi:cytochrome c3 family protein [Geomonas sp. RF6]|uniref:cytochrome c3 family protein n=1 Tax=Geomonas sp. RF6 TaxID=2897342 RepID=UPI001E3CFB9B|nr:cytochrome c3 family protein [Geomonas sp. RF6]UFS69826.1 cytochrome c3 family protein [Geomonas sp. RF6]